MIHKHIFVHAKPGMSEQDFFSYWKDVHAERYGRKIKQAKGYLINTRVPFGPEQGDPPFQGVAEVWIETSTGARFETTLMSLAEAGLDDKAFVGFGPANDPIISVTALDADGNLLGTFEAPRTGT